MHSVQLPRNTQSGRLNDPTQDRFDLILSGDVIVNFGYLHQLMVRRRTVLRQTGISPSKLRRRRSPTMPYSPLATSPITPDLLNRFRGLFAVEKSITTQIRLDAARSVMG